MKYTFISACIMTFCLCSFGDAQGLRDIFSRLDELDKRLVDVQASQDTSLSGFTQRLQELEASKPAASDNDAVSELKYEIGNIRKELDLVIGETIQLTQEVTSMDKPDTSSLSAEIRNIRAELARIKATVASQSSAATVVETTVSEEISEITDARGFDAYASADVTVMSQYVWRGLVINDEAVMQPSVTVGTGALSLNVWSSMDLTDANGYESEFNELDFTLDYSSGLASIAYSAGIIRYTFPNTVFDSTTELYLVLSSEKTGDASISVYQDIATAQGTYVSLGNSASIPVGDLFGIDIAGSLNWGSSRHNNYYYGHDSAAVTDAMASISSTFGLPGYITLTPMVMYSSLVNNSIRNLFESSNIDRDTLYGGLSVSAAW